MPYTFALASELHALSPSDRARVDHILIDDGEWTPAQIATAIATLTGACVITEPDPEDWTQPI